MSKRLRNFNRHTYTVMRPTETSPNVWELQYLRGKGLVVSTPSVGSVIDDSGFIQYDITSEINLKTRQLYPVLDNVQSDLTKPVMGNEFNPDFVVWNGVTYRTSGISLYNNFGDASYRDVLLGYDTALLTAPDPREIKWEEIEDFEQSINQTEMALELKLAPIDLCSLYN